MSVHDNRELKLSPNIWGAGGGGSPCGHRHRSARPGPGLGRGHKERGAPLCPAARGLPLSPGLHPWALESRYTHARLRTRVVCGFRAGVRLHQQRLRQLSISGLSQTPGVKPSPGRGCSSPGVPLKNFSNNSQASHSSWRAARISHSLQSHSFPNPHSPFPQSWKTSTRAPASGTARGSRAQTGTFVGEQLKKKSQSWVWRRRGYFSLPSPLTSLL